MSNELAYIEDVPAETGSYTGPAPDPDLNKISYNPVFPILTAKVKLNLPVADMCTDIMRMASKTKNYEGGFTTLINNVSIDNVRGISDLKQAIYGVTTSFGRELKYECDYDKCAIRVWATVMRRGGYDVTHSFSRSIFSGVFFAKAVEKSSPIVLSNPTTVYRSHEPPVRNEDKGPFTSENLMLPPEENHMVIWPSWMNHFVPEMQDAGPRITIGFTVDFLLPGA